MNRIRIVALAIAICVTLVSNASAALYGWSISKSNIDPLQNVGTPNGGIDTLYLWFWCMDQGWAAAEMTLESNHPEQILAFTPNGIVLNSGDTFHLLLSAGGCPSVPMVAGSILLLHTQPMFVCLGGANVTVDCLVDPPQAWPHLHHGYADVGQLPCPDNTDLCAPVSVEQQSWGSIKNVYR
jgi:hypothetical protein